MARSIIGPTTTPDEFDQAIWRLRGLGKGQDAKIFIQNLHAAAIRENQKLPQGTTPNVGQVVRDVQVQGIKANALQNFKAATARPEAALRIGVADALLKPVEIGAIERLPMETVLRLSAETFNAVKELYIRPKRMQFKSDYMPTKQEDITKFLESKYEEALVKIDKTLTKNLPAGDSDSPAFKTWLDGVKESLPIARSDIEKQKHNLAAADEKTKQNLPARVEGSKSGNEGQTTEITTEQQQQQQTETTQQQEVRTALEGKGRKGEQYDAYDKPYLNLNRPAFETEEGGIYKGFVNLYGFNDEKKPAYPVSAHFKNCGIPPGLMFTQSFSAKMDLGRSPGKVLGLQFLYKTNKGKIGAYLVTKLDAEQLVRDIEPHRALIKDLELRIISLPEDKGEQPKDYCTPVGDIGNVREVNQLNAISKLIMGYAAYTVAEEEALKDWFIHLKATEKSNLITTLHKRGAPEQTLSMLNDWKKIVVA